MPSWVEMVQENQPSQMYSWDILIMRSLRVLSSIRENLCLKWKCTSGPDLASSLSFQYPSVIPGVQVGTFLRKSVNSIKGEHAPSAREFRKLLSDKMAMLDMDKSFLSRYVNDGFSGGEKSG